MLYALLDDASQLIPQAQFYADEGLESLLDCTRQGVCARGIPVRLYVDNGKVYRSAQLARIAAPLCRTASPETGGWRCLNLSSALRNPLCLQPRS